MTIQDLITALVVAFTSSFFVTASVAMWKLCKHKVSERRRNWLVWLSFISIFPLLGLSASLELSGRISTIVPGPVIAVISLAAFKRAKVLKRKENMRIDLPTLLDSLVLNVAAGLALMPAFLTSGKVLSQKSPLRQEIEFLKRDIELGVSHAQALERLKDRIGLPGADAALEAIILALTLGTPIEKVLREQSRRMREQLLLEGERFANILSIKLLAPLFLFILPASFLVILSPVIIALLEYPSW